MFMLLLCHHIPAVVHSVHILAIHANIHAAVHAAVYAAVYAIIVRAVVAHVAVRTDVSAVICAAVNKYKKYLVLKAT